MRNQDAVIDTRYKSWRIRCFRCCVIACARAVSSVFRVEEKRNGELRRRRVSESSAPRRRGEHSK